jgi:hypothetical protein
MLQEMQKRREKQKTEADEYRKGRSGKGKSGKRQETGMAKKTEAKKIQRQKIKNSNRDQNKRIKKESPAAAGLITQEKRFLPVVITGGFSVYAFRIPTLRTAFTPARTSEIPYLICRKNVFP